MAAPNSVGEGARRLQQPAHDAGEAHAPAIRRLPDAAEGEGVLARDGAVTEDRDLEVHSCSLPVPINRTIPLNFAPSVQRAYYARNQVHSRDFDTQLDTLLRGLKSGI